jgi:glycosyltransferase involved in cell wall biosynthesis
MRIVQAVGWYFPSSAGGTEVYVSELTKCLRRAGHEVLIAAPDARAHDERTYEFEGVPVYRYPIAPRSSRAEAQGRRPVRGAEALHAWLRRTAPDVVHAHTFVTGLGLHELRVARSVARRVIATTHSASLGYACQRGSLMRWGRRVCDGRVGPATCAACALHDRRVPRPLAYVAAGLPSPVSAIAQHVPGPLGTALGMRGLIDFAGTSQREMFDAVDRFVVLTEWAREVLVGRGAPAEKISLNRLGIRFPRTRSPRAATTTPLTVAYIGRFDPIKGVEDLARAIRVLGRRVPVRFEFHGPARFMQDVAIRERLKQMAGGEAWVTFGGELDADGVQDVLARVDLVCCPSRVVEGGPTVALEARAAGVPVVGTTIPGLTEIVREGVDGRLVPIGDWRQLAAVFRDVAQDPTIVDRWRQALPRVRTMDDVAHDYLELYAA